MSLSLEKILIQFLMCFYEIACNKAFSLFMVLMNEGLQMSRDRPAENEIIRLNLVILVLFLSP